MGDQGWTTSYANGMPVKCARVCCDYLWTLYVSNQLYEDFHTKASRKPRLFVQAEKAEKQSFFGMLNPDGQETGSVSKVLTPPKPCSGIYHGIQNDQKKGQAWIKSSHYFIYNCAGEFWGDAYFRSSVLNIFFSWNNRISFWILDNHCDVEKWMPEPEIRAELQSWLYWALRANWYSPWAAASGPLGKMQRRTAHSLVEEHL